MIEISNLYSIQLYSYHAKSQQLPQGVYDGTKDRKKETTKNVVFDHYSSLWAIS